MAALTTAQTLAEQTRNHYAGLTARIFLARTAATQGKLRQAESQLLELVRQGGQIPVLVLAHYDLAGIYLEWNDIARAETHLQQGLADSLQHMNAEFENAGHILKACLLAAQGRLPEALAEVEASHTIAQSLNTDTQARALACQAALALASGDLGAATQCVDQMAVDIDVNSFYRFMGLTKARLLLAQGERAAARSLLAEKRSRAEVAGWGYAQVAIQVLQVLVAESTDEALDLLSRTLRQAQPQGYIRTFVESGTELIPLLQKAAQRGVVPDYVGEILQAFETGRKATAALAEPLSERELEVLRLVAAGMSNREIAGQLFITTGTAKTHVHNVCGKLGTRNRTEAATRAKELGLI